jgi:hypothetical protein
VRKGQLAQAELHEGRQDSAAVLLVGEHPGDDRVVLEGRGQRQGQPRGIGRDCFAYRRRSRHDLLPSPELKRTAGIVSLVQELIPVTVLSDLLNLRAADVRLDADEYRSAWVGC